MFCNALKKKHFVFPWWRSDARQWIGVVALTVGLSACSAAPEPEISGSAEKSEAVTAVLADTPPVKTFAEGFLIDAPTALQLQVGEQSARIPVRFEVADPDRLTVRVISNDSELLDPSRIELSPTGLQRELRIQAGERSGVAEVALVAFDGHSTARHSLRVAIVDPKNPVPPTSSPTASP